MGKRNDDDRKVVDIQSVPRRFAKKTDKEVLETFMFYTARGETIDEATYSTCRDLSISRPRVQEVVRKAELKEIAQEKKQEIYDEVYKDKVPLVKDIIALSLTSLKEYLIGISSKKDILLSMSVKDATGLAAIATRLNDLVRLEEGKSTHNVAMQVDARHTHEVTQTVFAKLGQLKQIDPVFEYPALPDVDLEKDDEPPQ